MAENNDIGSLSLSLSLSLSPSFYPRVKSHPTKASKPNFPSMPQQPHARHQLWRHLPEAPERERDSSSQSSLADTPPKLFKRTAV